MATLSNILGSLPNNYGSTITTTGDTATVISRINIKEPGCYLLESKVVGVSTATHEYNGTYWHFVTVKLDDAGTFAFVPGGTWRQVVDDNENDPGWNVHFDLVTNTDVEGDGTNDKLLRVLVTGWAALTVNWRSVSKLIRVS
jgi:hypothetical protein